MLALNIQAFYSIESLIFKKLISYWIISINNCLVYTINGYYFAINNNEIILLENFKITINLKNSYKNNS